MKDIALKIIQVCVEGPVSFFVVCCGISAVCFGIGAAIAQVIKAFK